MKYLILFFPLLVFGQRPTRIADTIKIDVVAVYEDVVRMGYKSEQIFTLLAEKYEIRKDTVMAKKYRALALKEKRI